MRWPPIMTHYAYSVTALILEWPIKVAAACDTLLVSLAGYAVPVALTGIRTCCDSFELRTS